MPSTSPTKAPQAIAFDVTTTVPLLLLPVRLETRFRGNQLLVRVYPDAVHVDSFEPRLTEVEIEWRTRFWQQTKLAKNEPDPEARKAKERNAWKQLVQVFGPQRAAWIAKQETTNQAEKLVDPRTAHTACTELLPDHWVASGLFSYEENGDLKSDTLFKRGNNIKYEGDSDRIFVMPRLEEGLTPDTFKDDPYVGWLVNFARAEQIGMGLTIDLPGSKWKIDQLFVYGVKASLKAEDAKRRLEKALEAHRYTQGLGFVSQGTLTNNTISASSGYSSEAVDSFEIERQQTALTEPGSKPNYAVMAEALNINPTILVNVQDAITQEQRAARDMNDMLWEATWGYFLKEMLALKDSHQNDIDNKMKGHFVDYVRARGPLPALRIGTQPYGVLPVMALAEGNNQTALPNPVACLRALREIWRKSLEHVPRLDRPQTPEQQKNNSDTLLQVLAMTPTGIDYVGRNCTRIVAVSSPTSDESRKKTGRVPLPTELQTALDAMLGNDTVTPHQRTVFTSPSGLFLLRSSSDEDGDFGENGHIFLFNLLTASGDFGAFPKAARELLLRETLDLCSHRLDAWITSLATKRLAELRAEQPQGLSIGGYGWVENLEPDQVNNNKDPDAYIHAPSLVHATTAAILRSGYLTRRSRDTPPDNTDGNALAINLTSDRIRLALHLVDGVRGGQSLGTLLGYRFERALHENNKDGSIPKFRELFPGSTELISTADPSKETQKKLSHLVLDGLALLTSYKIYKKLKNPSDPPDPIPDVPEKPIPPELPELIDRWQCQPEVDRLEEALDAVADLVLAESVHHVAQGNHVRAGATLEAITRGETPPPELEFVRTPRTGINHTHRISMIFSTLPTPPTPVPWSITTPRAQAEPLLNAWAAQLLGPEAEKAFCTVTYIENSKLQFLNVTIEDLKLAPLDLVYLLDGEVGGKQSEIEQRILYFVQKDKSDKPPITDICLGFDRSDGGVPPSLGEIVEVARTIRRLLTGARALEPRDVQLPEQAAIDAAWPLDQSLVARATAVQDAFLKAVDLLRTKLPEKPETPLADPPAVRQALMGLAAYGLMGSVPSNPADNSDVAIKQLHAQARAVLSEAQKRQQRAQAVSTSITTTAQALEVFKAIFGEDFRVLPSFTPQNGKDLTQTFAKSTAWQGGDPLASITWFQRIARVRDGAARLDSTMQYAEALNGPSLNFQIGQLPYGDGERWVALENPPQGNRLSLACLTTVKDFTKPLAGLMVEEWVESVPNKEEMTGLTFHYDAPQPRAPQAILLALAPDGLDQWDSTTLENTLRETLELAKLRAVDLTALGELGQYLPAMYVDSDKFPDTIRSYLSKGNQ